ncbi:hypothetical protein [Draconibacterium halophilum]|uniref:UspA domain-containing protein n=1 Tax=Draconibacterium halophilum TaxID=2706887 RepID=A0A6C0REC1_9BACT|nr:hypothetical protein [Draconibacterium halophilum]QIA08417.1 hypothetical protein G0Q07_12150 [Draconibacterium halophilum]
MTDSKEQKIVVYTELKETDQNLILHGLKLAAIFKKELCLLYNYHPKQKKQRDELKEKLQKYAAIVKQEMPEQKVSTLLTSESQTELPDLLAIDYEAIMIVLNSLNFKRYSTALAETSIPFLFVHPESKITDYNHLVQPIDLRKEISDSSLWCSYFGRFYGAQIVTIAARDKTQEAKNKVYKNTALTRKLYKKFKITHKCFKGSKSSLRNVFEALELALASDCNLLVILGSSSITPLDLLVGLPERKIINHAGKLPVMVINPRKDNYILCD